MKIIKFIFFDGPKKVNQKYQTSIYYDFAGSGLLRQYKLAYFYDKTLQFLIINLFNF